MTFMTKYLPMNLRRGDVVLAQVPMPSTQLTQFKLRPAVIISAFSQKSNFIHLGYCEKRDEPVKSLI